MPFVDRLLCTMVGATNRVYTIHPKHFLVNYPQQIPDTEFTDPASTQRTETSLMQMQARIRLAETCRDIVDAMPLGGGDIDTLTFPQLAALDKQFAQILDELSALDTPPSPSHADNNLDRAQRRLALQRAIGVVSIHARRAKLLRPLLRTRNLAGRFQGLRDQCLRSAETVIDIASTVLSETVDTPGSRGTSQHNGANELTAHRSPYHSGIVINHVRFRVPILTILALSLPLCTHSFRGCSPHPVPCNPSLVSTVQPLIH